MRSSAYILFYCLVLQECLCIYLPGDEVEQKPMLSTGIKTTNYRRLNSNLQMHQNYSKVYIHNNPNTIRPNSDVTDVPKIFPIYNGHTYGQSPNNSQRFIQINSQTTSRANRTGVVDGVQNRRTIYKRKIEKPIEVYLKCPPHSTGTFVYEKFCNQYLNCWNGRGFVQNCAPGTLFNPKTLSCDYPNKVECITGPRLNTLKEYSTSTFVPQVSCPAGFTGLIPNYTDCSKFINCNNGQQHSMDCPPGTLFNINQNVCDHPHNSLCFNGEKGKFEKGLTGEIGRNEQIIHQNGYDRLVHYEVYGSNGAQTNVHRVNSNLNFATTDCGPENRNSPHCNNNPSHQENVGYGTNQRTNCDPTRHNCQFSNCNPQSSNCQTNLGNHHASGGSQNGNFQPQMTTNYQNICNINDPGCHRNTGVPSTNPNIPVKPYSTNNHPNIPIKCPEGVQGVHKHPTDCKKFLNCANGMTFIQDCGPGTLFNPNLGVCDFPHNVKCDQQTQSASEGTFFGTQQQNYHHETQRYNTNCPSGRNCNNNVGGQPIHGSTTPKYLYVTAVNHDQQQQTYPNCPGGTNCNVGGENGPNSHTTPKYFYITRSHQGNSGPQQNNLGQPQQPHHETQQTYYNPNCPTGCIGGGQQTYGSSGPTTPKYLHANQGQQTYNTNCPSGTNCNLGWPQIYGSSSSVTPKYLHVNQGHSGHIDQQQQTYYNPNCPSGTKCNGNRQQIFGNGASKPTTPTYPYNSGHTSQQIQIDSNTGMYKHVATTTGKPWPPSFPDSIPSTDLNADYVVEYADGGEEIDLQAENAIEDNKRRGKCNKDDFYCDPMNCVLKTQVCDGKRDCSNGNDEKDCKKYMEKFAVYKNSRLATSEKQRWNNVSFATCAMLCLGAQKMQCKSFNYRKIDRTCFLTDFNIGLTGALISYYPCDYYELKSASIDCTKLYECSNKKCIKSSQLCDGQNDCSDRMDEKNCKAEDFGYKIKLAGSKNKHEGRVEVTAFEKVGYICDDHFGLLDAEVICKELGFPLGAAEVRLNSYFAKDITEKNTFYMIDELGCTGNETTLINCDFSGWGVHDCGNHEIAGVVCKTPKEKCGKDQWKCDTGIECIPIPYVCDGLNDCSDDSDEGTQHCESPIVLRLANGTRPSEGRIEIRYHDMWGTVCDDDFNEDAAKVVCKYLGFTGKATIKKDGYFGPGKDPIWLDQVYCYGNETSLVDCEHWNWGENNCDHNEDVGVVCSNEMGEVEFERHSKLVPNIEPQINPASCGFRNDNIFLQNDEVHFRVVRGSIAKKGEYPWQAVLRARGIGKSAHWCGAVVISNKWVLTAAHCLSGYSKGAYIVVAGDYNVDEDEGTEQEAYIDEFYVHDNFREGQKMNNDIALIKLKGRFKLNQDVQPICLPDADTNYEQMLNCTISGFGSTGSGKSTYSHNLRAGWIPIQKTEICKMPHVYGNLITDGMICAGFLDEGVDACDGDSGGPLACLNNGLFTLYGMTSWGHHCGYANKPGVYVKIAHYRKWIDDTMRKYS